jgi:hypothetical protein
MSLIRGRIMGLTLGTIPSTYNEMHCRSSVAGLPTFVASILVAYFLNIASQKIHQVQSIIFAFVD